ncbi:MAG TPA: hypothetical protein VIV12_27785, partial [Streptosporangiaceae bacterium]
QAEGTRPAVYDPRWVADGQFNLVAEYPEEENLALTDLVASLADRGHASLDDVLAARGKSNIENERLKIDRDRLMKLPAIDMLRLQRVAEKLGDADMQQVIQQQAAGQMSQARVPGVLKGIPQAALNGGGGGGQSIAGSVRGGIEGAIQGGDAMAQQAQAAAAGGQAA